MSVEEPRPTKSGMKVAKRSTSTPPASWFDELYAAIWKILPVGTMLHVQAVHRESPTFGEPVVELISVPDKTVVMVPQSWFTTANFRLLPELCGQQNPLFQEPRYPTK